jgi:hypothetical protein
MITGLLLLVERQRCVVFAAAQDELRVGSL